jgi:hypothetical protein
MPFETTASIAAVEQFVVNKDRTPALESADFRSRKF